MTSLGVTMNYQKLSISPCYIVESFHQYPKEFSSYADDIALLIYDIFGEPTKTEEVPGILQTLLKSTLDSRNVDIHRTSFCCLDGTNAMSGEQSTQVFKEEFAIWLLIQYM